MNTTVVNLRTEVRQLAEEAFHHRLISGYGDGQNNNEFQIVLEGKPRHFSLKEAIYFLRNLINHNDLDRMLAND
jgi:hypothetical protein